MVFQYSELIVIGGSQGQFSGGDKPHPYLLGKTSFVVAGFIPACKGQNVEKIAQSGSILFDRIYKPSLEELRCGRQD